jgi:CPA1 family monovalent cation:H+ antiporter
VETLDVVLLLLGCVALSGLLSRIPKISLPLPFVQIALGAMVSLFAGRTVHVDPEVFLVLFIAPLLYLDGWRIQKDGLIRNRWTITALALGLVVFTVIVAGLFIHWLIPAMPLAVAFALSSVLSPTDAVAVSAITARTRMPPRLMEVLEGESLLNDASGLVCFRFAVAAALTGVFSPGEALGLFTWLAIGGVVTGAGTALVANGVKDFMSHRFGEEPGSQIIISLLIPFAAYLLAARLHASGVLAAVAAGIAMNREEQSGRAQPATRLRPAAVWDAVQFAGNGAIFVILGNQLSAIVLAAMSQRVLIGHQSPLWLLGYVLAVTFVLAVLRFVWAGVTLGLIHPVFDGAGWRLMPAMRLAAAASLAGVRGAVTLSGVMTLPLLVADGSPFPGRDLAIFIASGVIVVSLLSASLGLPLVLHGLATMQRVPVRAAEDAVRRLSAEAAMEAIERWLAMQADVGHDTPMYAALSTKVLAAYRERLQAPAGVTADAGWLSRFDALEREAAVVGLQAERATVYRLTREGRVGERVGRRLVRQLDLLEFRYSGRTDVAGRD